MLLTGKKIIVGVCGSIAAYKSVYLVRQLVKAGAEVQVLLTPDAKHFVGPITFSTLSKRPVHDAIANDDAWNNHVELGLWADLLIIAPATANTLAKMAQGICDNALLATYLSARCPVWIAPAMDLDMWQHSSTQRNVATLQSDGVKLIPVEDGELASGLHGAGRMAEPESITAEVELFLGRKQDLRAKTILVTAGPTYEDLDPVRYIGNRSSGKMGIALAQDALARGAEVYLVLGPSSERVASHPNLHLRPVRSAADMANASLEAWPLCHAGILAAAVADYRPQSESKEKIKKKSGDLALDLVRTQDIAITLHGKRSEGQQLIGFALETKDLTANAQAKMTRKGFNMIVANSPLDKGAAFQHDTNKVTLLWPDGESRALPLMPKTEVAQHIVDELTNLFDNT